MRDLSIRGYGVVFVIGLLTQIITSVTWQNFESENVGYDVFMVGQAAGELCYISACRRLFQKHGLFLAVCEFAISLILVDIFTILVLNPFEISVQKYVAFIFATLVLMVRVKKYFKPNG